MPVQNGKKNVLESPAPAAEENIYSYWKDEDHSDKRGMRVSIAVAAVLHAVLLTVTFPRLYSQELADDANERKLFVVEVPRFKPRPPPPTDVPEKLVKKIPIPDPEPDKPEPFVADVIASPDLDFDVDTALVFNVPDPPPVPETKDVYFAGGDIERPERIHYVRPAYTEIARRARIEGLVIVKAIIDERGGVIDLEVLRSQPMGLTEEAVKAVGQWRYHPSTVDGRPVKVVLTVSVNFQLQ